MEHFHSDWTFKPITMLHVNAPSDEARMCLHTSRGCDVTLSLTHTRTHTHDTHNSAFEQSIANT